jgi:uncharacterized protein
LYPAGNLFISAPHGRLEGLLKEAREAPGIGAALVLHPHPLHGGTMHNKVVFRAAAALNEAGLTVLRINFRGVGLSTGSHDEGRGEHDDARAALDYLTATYPHRLLTLAGFSFGARVGLEVGLADPRVTHLVGIGTPVNMYDFDFLDLCHKPILFVHGELDEFGQVERLKALAARIGEHATIKVEIIPGADHFFEGHLDEMKRAIRDWVEKEVRSIAD